MASDTPPPPASGRLTRDALGAPGIVFLVLAAVAPLTATVVVVPLGIALGNGGGIPGSFVFVAVILLLFSVGYVQMSRHVVNAGAFYAYVTRAMGRLPGLATAFIALLGYNTFVIGATATSGFFTAMVFGTVLHLDLPWEVWSAVSVILVFLLGRRGVDISARVLGVALVLEVTILLVMDVSILVQQGFHLHAFSPHVVFGGAAGLALLFAFTGFLGFEATALFGEEARDPRRTLPRATYAAILLIGAFYALTTWSLVSAVGVARAGAVAGADPGGFVFAIAKRYVGVALTDAMQILLVISLFAALLALHNAATRYIFAMGRARVLPQALGRTHAKRGSPAAASGTQMALTTAAVAAFALAGADPIGVIVPSMIGFGTLSIIALQAAAAVAVVVFFRRRRDSRLGSTLIAPGLGALGLLFALAMAIANFGTIAGSDAPVITRLPWALLVTVLVAVAVGLRLAARRPDVYAQLGRDFVGEVRDDADRPGLGPAGGARLGGAEETPATGS